ncbi:MAG: hypothetical protein ACYC5O_18405 [Anaerolineae bacterium]
MTREELIARCRKAPDVGDVKNEDFVDYITVIERRRRIDKGWVTDGTPYMSVDGRLAMANADHRSQSKRLSFENPVVLVDNDEQLTLMVAIDSEIYGRRHGIATSRKVDGAPIEMQHPWEIAETSAMGRALAAMGYGLLPGSGLASAEDMLRAGERPGAPAPRGTVAAPVRLSERQQAYLVNAYARTHDVSAEEATAALGTLCQERFGHDLDSCTPNEGRELSLDLRDRRDESATDNAA